MFCKTCGNELNENAVICPKCGCSTNDKLNVKNKVAFDNQKIENLLLTLFPYLTVGLMCLTLTFFALSIITPYYYDADYYLAEGLCIVSLIFSILSYCTATTTFIYGLVKNAKEPFRNISHFIMVNCLLFVSIYATVLSC